MAQHDVRWYPIVDYSTNWAGVISGDSNSMVAPRTTGRLRHLRERVRPALRARRQLLALAPEPAAAAGDELRDLERGELDAVPAPADERARAYADLYMAARAAIKPVDPQARWWSAGCRSAPRAAAPTRSVPPAHVRPPPRHEGLRGRGRAPPVPAAVSDVYARIAHFRAALDQLAGPQVPLEITEVGWSTTAVSDSERGTRPRRRSRSELPRC